MSRTKQGKGMNDKSVIVAVVVSIALVVAATLISSGMKTVGRSIQAAGASIGDGIARTGLSTGNPSKFQVHISDGGNPFRISNPEK